MTEDTQKLADIRGTFAFTATPKAGGNTAHAQRKYFWLYARWKRIVEAVTRDRESR